MYRLCFLYYMNNINLYASICIDDTGSESFLAPSTMTKDEKSNSDGEIQQTAREDRHERSQSCEEVASQEKMNTSNQQMNKCKVNYQGSSLHYWYF